jgi:hypothetical protein
MLLAAAAAYAAAAAEQHPADREHDAKLVDCGKRLAVGAVHRELFSTVNSLLTGKNSRELRSVGLSSRH